MTDLSNILESIYPLSAISKEILVSIFKETHHKKGTIILTQDKTENKFYFIKKGIVRAYTLSDGDEITFWFGQEQQPILSMKNYVDRKVSYETIELLEDCILYETTISSLTKLYETSIEIANWGRKLAENELIKTEERFIARQIGTATQRYHLLLQTHPGLINRIQLSYIASYLGITQVSLSRIRNGK